MTLISISEASQLTGKSIPTIYRHVKAGKLSKTGDKIDTAEILRFYGEFKKTTDNQYSQNDNQVDNLKLSMLQRENELLRGQIERDREQLAREIAQADYWRQTATMLLSHQPTEPPQQDSNYTGKLEESALWRKLFGRRG
jgi:hypothetical protein